MIQKSYRLIPPNYSIIIHAEMKLELIIDRCIRDEIRKANPNSNGKYRQIGLMPRQKPTYRKDNINITSK